MKNKNILILAPHTDDGELGCGATAAKLIEEGANVFYIAFSICEESVPDGYPKDTLENEARKATAILGIKKENLLIKYYPVRKLNSFRQDILEELIIHRKEINPDIIFMPCSKSLHQDHKTIYEEGIRAFKQYTCYGYDLPWDTIQFPATSFFKLESKHVEIKIKAMKCYETQNFRTYCDDEFIRGLARIRGAQIGERYAESFELIRLINK